MRSLLVTKAGIDTFHTTRRLLRQTFSHVRMEIWHYATTKSTDVKPALLQFHPTPSVLNEASGTYHHDLSLNFSRTSYGLLAFMVLEGSRKFKACEF